MYATPVRAAVCTALPADAAHWWRGDGNVQDSVGASHGDLRNGATYAGGLAQEAFSLDGIDDYVALAPGIDVQRTVTVEAWVNLAEQESEEIKIYYHDANKGEFALVVNADLTAGIAVKLADTNWYEAVSTAAPLALGGWHHLAGTYDGVVGSLSIAVDGVVRETIATPALPVFHIGGFPPAIGAYAQNAYGNANFFRGLVDEVTVYGRVLSAGEIAAIYHSGAAGKCAPGEQPPPENQAPTLAFSQEAGYVTDGVSPDKGTADLTPLVFKAVYTDADNDPPGFVVITIDNGGGGILSHLTPDTGDSVPPALKDGDYTNGEQYAYTSTFPRGQYQYHFEASDLEMTARLPVTGELSFQTGYSNVAFLPGFLGSRLYQYDSNCTINCENQLWDPNIPFLGDVQKLYLDTSGNPINPDIYTKPRDVINESWQNPLGPGTNVYKRFIEFMDNDLVGNGVINDWEPVSYDWRLPLQTIVDTGVYRAGGVFVDLVDEIEDLAATSASGKVTLIGHSNGGLLAKVFINRLSNEGKASLVDRLVMVGTPQLGTPEVLEKLLHGLGPANETTRELVENMSGAYNFIPSPVYFQRVASPVIEFDSEVSAIYDFPSIYGEGVETVSELTKFFLGDNGLRTEPQSGDTDAPNVLKENLLAQAQGIHAILDLWTPPGDIEVIQIVGWGLDTKRGIRYDDCDMPFCSQTLSHLDRNPLETENGDGTVVTPSAAAMSVPTYYLNLPDANRGAQANREHSNVLEVNVLQDFIKQIVLRTVHNDVLPEHISSNQPTSTQQNKKLRIRGLSPISINVYDSLGNHTGLIQDIEPQLFEIQIPNSNYYKIGEKTYIGLDTQDQYRIEIEGLALGSFTLEIDEVFNDEMLDSTAYTNIPVTKTTKATLTTQTVDTTSSLSIDIQGDGTPDVTVNPSQDPDPRVSLKALRVVVNTMVFQKGLKNAIIKQIETAEKALDKGLTKTADGILKGIVKQLQNYPKVIINPTDAQALIQMIEVIRASMVL